MSLKIETEKFGDFLEEARESDINNGTLGEKGETKLTQYYNIYHGIRTKYEELTKETSYVGSEDRAKVKRILDGIEKEVERLRILNE